jgi:hypothetical protein
MLKANTKKAKANLKAVMIREVSGWDHDPTTAEEAAEILAREFITGATWGDGKIHPIGKQRTIQDVFEDWGAGLPNSIFDSIYLGSAKDLVAEILEETEEEKNKYTEEKAEKLMCALLWIHGGVSDAFYKHYKGF